MEGLWIKGRSDVFIVEMNLSQVRGSRIIGTAKKENARNPGGHYGRGRNCRQMRITRTIRRTVGKNGTGSIPVITGNTAERIRIIQREIVKYRDNVISYGVRMGVIK